MAADVWTANKYIREPAGDGGSPRIPTLRVINQADEQVLINDNEDKARTFVKMFFPPPPPRVEDHKDYQYPEPLLDPPLLTVRYEGTYQSYPPTSLRVQMAFQI